MNYGTEICLIAVLAIYSYMDIRTRKLPVGWVMLNVAVSCIYATLREISQGDGAFWQTGVNMVLGMVPGAGMLLLAAVRPRMLGAGDGLVLLIIGNMLGASKCLAVLVWALFCAFLYSCVLLICCKKGKEYGFPFIPFYLLGVILVCVL